ncbi:MAG: hypothetical protein ACKVKO_02340 [Acidimicrobiales bacterium]|jgi:hypothetical protein
MPFWVRLIIAVVTAFLLMRSGMRLLGGMSQMMPEPPPPGELRKVRIMYRCSLCGTEVQMRMAPDEDPPAPRHCLEDMDLVAPVEE